METKELNNLIGDKNLLEARINLYLRKKILRKQKIEKNEIRGHLAKAEHNLLFVTELKDSEFGDWLIAGCYYALYHSTLALILSKGYVSKNHNATLCVLMKEFFEKEIELLEIEMLNRFFIISNDLIFYADIKEKRKEASYSTKTLFNKEELMEMRQRTIEYVNKIKILLEGI